MDEKIKIYRELLKGWMRTNLPTYYDNTYDNGVNEGLGIALAEFEELFIEEKQ